MRLHTNIVLWVILATVAPMVTLVTGTNLYSEWRYRQEVNGQMTRTLNRIVAQLDQRLVFDRALVRALAQVPDVQDYLPVLAAASRGESHPESVERNARLERLLASFQGALPSIASVRILDLNGNAVITARLGAPANGFLFGEEEPPPLPVLDRMRELAAGDVGFLHIPLEEDVFRPPGLLDAVAPLHGHDRRVGYLAARLDAAAYDRLLERIPRPYGAQILILENDTDSPNRDRLPLYVDGAESRFHAPDPHLPLPYVPVLWDALSGGDGRFQYDRWEIHYTEYQPYPGRLGSWVVGLRLDLEDLRLPFRRIGLGILLFAAVAVLLSLALAQLGARKLAKPVSELGEGLQAFAKGNQDRRFELRGPTEIRQLQQSFNTMAETLLTTQRERDQVRDLMLRNAKLASLGEMAAGIGHEINNPLNHILALVRLMEQEAAQAPEAASPGFRQDLQSLREEADRASKIVAGILDFARQRLPAKRRFPVAQWLEETVRLLQHAADAKGVRLRTTCEPGLEILGDRGQLQQVLVNLGLNAIQAGPESGRVEINVSRTDDYVEIRIRDRGPGIAAENRDKLFDPFFTTKAPGQGSGLGLSISLGILEHHAGRLSLENHPDGGALALMRLPRSFG